MQSVWLWSTKVFSGSKGYVLKGFVGAPPSAFLGVSKCLHMQADGVVFIGFVCFAFTKTFNGNMMFEYDN